MMLMPCGPSAVPTGGAGVARPACSSSFKTARTFFLPTSYLSIYAALVNFLDLQQVELDRRLAADGAGEASLPRGTPSVANYARRRLEGALVTAGMNPASSSTLGSDHQ